MVCVGSDLYRTTHLKTVSRRIPSTLWFLKLLRPEYVGFGSAFVGGAGKMPFCMLVLSICIYLVNYHVISMYTSVLLHCKYSKMYIKRKLCR